MTVDGLGEVVDPLEHQLALAEVLVSPIGPTPSTTQTAANSSPPSGSIQQDAHGDDAQ